MPALHAPRGVAALRLAAAALLLLALLCACKARQGVHLEEGEHATADDLLARITELNESGRYAEAIPLAARLHEAVRKRNGASHPAVAAALSMQGGLYVSFGDYAKARPLLEQALEIMERTDGPDGLGTATCLGMLARLHAGEGDFKAALPYAERALAIRRAKLPADSLVLSTSLHNLGEIQARLGRPALAEPLLTRALEIREAKGNLHALALTLTVLSGLYLDQNALDAAETAARAAVDCARQALEPEHPHTAEALMALGRALAAKGDHQQAFQQMLEAQNAQIALIERIKGSTSEQQKLAFLARSERDFHQFLTLAARRLSGSAQAREATLGVVLRRKGAVLEVQKAFQEALLSGDEATRRLFEELCRTRAALSHAAFAVEEEPRDAKRLAGLKARAEELEVRLAGMSAGWQRARTMQAADARSVADALPQGAALLELVRHHAAPLAPGEQPGGERYLAFVLQPGAEVHLVDLGLAANVEGAVRSFLETIQPAGPGGGEARWRGPCRRLHDAAYAPLAQALARAREVFVAPDAALSLAPFEVMAAPDGRFLVERHGFTYLTSGRELLGMRGNGGRPGRAILLGDPDFDRGAPPGGATQTRKPPSEVRGVEDLWFSPLPGTRREVRSIQALLGPDACDLRLGVQADVEALLGARSPEVLHVATHGFFLPAVRPGDAADPGLLGRSGLALAGANAGPQGLLTASKALALDLKDTRMVVLSGCNTGTGDVRGGEGVFGLRRAFAQAGARSLVMSFWPVPDRESAELMGEFYRTLAQSQGMKRSEALRQAMLRQKEAVRARFGHPDPFFWGAFAFVGDPG